MLRLSLLLCLLFTACEPVNRYFGLDDENWIEETGEVILEAKTGIHADFTPSSPEKK